MKVLDQIHVSQKIDLNSYFFELFNHIHVTQKTFMNSTFFDIVKSCPFHFTNIHELLMFSIC